MLGKALPGKQDPSPRAVSVFLEILRPVLHRLLLSFSLRVDAARVDSAGPANLSKSHPVNVESGMNTSSCVTTLSHRAPRHIPHIPWAQELSTRQAGPVAGRKQPQRDT